MWGEKVVAGAAKLIPVFLTADLTFRKTGIIEYIPADNQLRWAEMIKIKLFVVFFGLYADFFFVT